MNIFPVKWNIMDEKERFTALFCRALCLTLLFLICIYPSHSYAVCSNNEAGNPGVAGEIEFFSSTNRLMYCDDTNWVLMTYDPPAAPDSSSDIFIEPQFFADPYEDFLAPISNQFFIHNPKVLNPFLYSSVYAPYGMNFNGSSYLINTSASGYTNSDSFLLSFWVKPTTEAADFQVIMNANTGAADRFILALDNGSNNTNNLWTIYLEGRNSSGALVAEYESAEVLQAGKWNHVAISADVSASLFKVYINDATDTNYINLNPGNGNINFNVSEYGIGQFTGGGDSLAASISEFWFDTATYLDLDSSSNRRQFTSSSLEPVYLGTNGDIPTGSAPDIFLSGDPSTWEANDGTGGGFTESGTLAADTNTSYGSPYCTGSNSLTTQLSAHYDFEEGSGSTLADKEGSLTGTLTNFNTSTAWVEGIEGNYALDFDGTNDWISFPSSGSANFDTVTISFWMNPDVVTSSKNGIVLLENRSPAGSNYEVAIDGSGNGSSNDGLIKLAYFSGSWRNLISSISPVVGEWQHISITVDPISNTYEFYLNGELTDSGPTSADLDSSFSNLTLAVGISDDTANNDYYNGRMDGLRLYSRALASDEINGIYQVENSGCGDLVAHWKLDETSGSSIADASGTNNGTWTDGGDNNVSGETTEGVVNNALDFPGHINTGSAASMDNLYAGNGMSVCAWIKPDSVPGANAPIVGKNGNSFGQYGWSVYLNKAGGNTIEFYTNLDSYIAPNVSYTLGEWQHICFTWDGNEGTAGLTSYINGAEPSGTTYLGDDSATVYDDSTYNINIGYDPGASTSFDGKIDDVRIYDRVISASEVQNLYNASVPTLIGWWKLDETSGTTAADSSVYGGNGSYTDALDPSVDSEDAVFGLGLNFADAFTTSNNRVTAPNILAYDSVKPLTFSAWVKPLKFTGHMGVIELSNMAHLRFEWNSSNLTFHTSGWSGGAVNWRGTSTGINVNEWTHIAVTYDPSSTANDPVFYVNGQTTSIVQSGTPSGTYSNPGTSAVNIGRAVWNGTGNNFKGVIDDARIYNRVLSATEIQSLYKEANSALVGHWKLDEASGTSAADSSQYANTGTLQNGLNAGNDRVDGIIDSGLNFDGSDDYVQIPNSPELNIEEDWTISSWFRIDGGTSGAHQIISKAHDPTDTSNYDMDVNEPEKSLRCSFRGNGFRSTADVSDSIEYGKWYHGACIWDSNTNTLSSYLNGALLNATVITIEDPAVNSGDLYIGHDPENGEYLNGEVDDIRVYNRALTTTELSRLYNNPNEALLAYWKMDETSGTTTADSSGNGYNGTMQGSMDAANDSIDSIHSTAFSFDGTDDYIDIGTSGIFDGAGTGSICAWINPDDLDNDSFIISDIEGNGTGWAFFGDRVGFSSGNPNIISFVVRGSTASARVESPANNIEFGVWNHYCGTFNGSNFIRLYQNGQLINETTSGVPATFQTSTSDTNIGRGITSGYFDGAIDDLRLYKRALTTAEVQELYQTSQGGLVAFWKMDETSGTSVADSSGNGNTGTHSSATPTWSTGVINNAVDIDDGERILVPSFDVDGTGLTISTWVYPENPSFGSDEDPRIIVKADGANTTTHDWGLFYDQNPGTNELVLRLAIEEGSGNNYASGIVLTPDQWTHVAVTYDVNSGDIEFYENGTSASTVTTSGGAVKKSNKSIAIGNRPDALDRQFHGKIDNLRVYEKPLSASEIQNLYRADFSGLVAHYKLDETSGSTANDSSPFTNDGSLDGGMLAQSATIDGPVGTGFSFDGVNDRIDNLPFGAGELGDINTLAFWAKLNTSTIAVGFGRSAEATRVFGFNGGDLRYANAPGSGITISPGTDLTQWNHFAYIRNGLNVDFYVNGEFKGSGTLSDATATRIDQFGARASIDFIDGAADDLRIYNIALTPSQITDIYNAGDPPTDSTNNGLIGYWKMDETSGTTAADNSDLANDGALSGGMDASADTVSGKVGTALNFDGTNDQIIVPANSSYDFATGFSFTAAAWIKMSAPCSGNKVFISNREGTTKQWWLGCQNGSNAAYFQVESSEDQYITGSTAINDGNWHHVVGRYNGSSDVIELIVDGVVVASQSHAITGNMVTGNPICIGNYGVSCTDSYYYGGDMDEVRLYDRALSNSEIQILTSCTKPGTQFYNEYSKVMQWCEDSSAVQNMGPANSGSGGCGGSLEGSLRYDGTGQTYEFCDGNGWVSIPGGSVSGTPAISFVDSAKDETGATSRTYSNISFGTPAAGRIIAVSISYRETLTGPTATPAPLSSVTIAGQTATQAVQVSANERTASSIWYATVNSGSVGDIVLNGSNEFSSSISVFALTGLSSGTPVDTDSSGASSAVTTLSNTLNIQDGGVGICGAANANDIDTISWSGTNITLASNIQNASARDHQHSSAITLNTSGSDASRTFTSSWGGAEFASQVCASWK